MKKNLLVSSFFFFLFSFLCIPLYSQNKIFVPAVDGVGSKDDNDFFLKQLNNEIKYQNQSVTRFMAGSDYILKTTIVRFSEFEHTELARNNTNYEFVLILELLETKTTNLFATQYIVYSSVEQGLDKMISTVVSNLFANLPAGSISYYQKYFIGASLYWLPKIYQEGSSCIYWQNFGLGLKGEYYFFNFLSAELGVLVSQDWVNVIQSVDEYKDIIIEIPVAVKFMVRPADNLILGPLAGVSANFSIQGNTNPSIVSAFIGMEFGVFAGIGMITLDPRLNLDIFESKINSQEIGSNISYRRNAVQVGIGYKIGFPVGKPQITANPQPAQAPAPAPAAPAPAPQPPAPRQPRERNSGNQIYFF